MLEIKPIKWMKNKLYDYQAEKIDNLNKEYSRIDTLIKQREQQLLDINKLKDRVENELKLLKGKKYNLKKKIKPYIT